MATYILLLDALRCAQFLWAVLAELPFLHHQ